MVFSEEANTGGLMRRRAWLRGVAASLAGAYQSSLLNRANAAAFVSGRGPYGPLEGPDENGLCLPAGFFGRIIARSGVPVVPGGLPWHLAPDGGACISLAEGGYAYVSNSEVLRGGGVGALLFDPCGRLVGSRTLLSGTSMNCAGGATPWGTWLSCEEWPGGRVHECYLDGRAAIALGALGVFTHEAVTVDPERQQLYLTEDRPDGRWYRFTPEAYPDLTVGLLEAARVDWDESGRNGRIEWVAAPTRRSAASDPVVAPDTTAFRGGEGCYYAQGQVFFTTKGDNRVWRYWPDEERLECLYAASDDPSAPLRGVDNVVVADSGDVIVAEDGDDMQLCVLSAEGEVAPLLQVLGHETSELTGLAFDPSGSRLYFSSQRGIGGAGAGVTFEVVGPFR